MMGFGTTTVEAKSGYGLATEHELKALEVIKDLNDHHRMDLVATFMGAHLSPRNISPTAKSTSALCARR